MQVCIVDEKTHITGTTVATYTHAHITGTVKTNTHNVENVYHSEIP